MIAIIGSRAVQHYFEDARNAKDWDLIVSPDAVDSAKEVIGGRWREKREGHFVSYNGNKIVEIWIANPGTSEELILKTCVDKIDSPYGEVYVPSKEAICAIKRTHLYWHYKWHKHIEDYHFLKAKGIEFDKEIFKLRRSEHEDRLGKNHINLNMSNERFFEKSQKMVKRYFDHDDLHTATCYFGLPLFKRCKHNMDLAKIDQDLFLELEFEDRLKMVKEECYALALEREVIPALMNYWPKGQLAKTNSKRAYSRWLMKLSTTVSRGWFREFVIENYPSLKHPDKDYVNEFVKAAAKGKVRYYGEERYTDSFMSEFFSKLKFKDQATTEQNKEKSSV